MSLFPDLAPSIDGVDFFAAFDSCSAQTLSEQGKIRRPVRHNGDLWVATNTSTWGVKHYAACSMYRLSPAESFDGPTRNFQDRAAFNRSNTVGPWHGVIAMHGGKAYVLTGPAIQLEIEGEDAYSDFERKQRAKWANLQDEDDVDEEADAAAEAEGFDFDGEDDDDDLGDFGEFDDGGRTRIGNTPDDGDDDEEGMTDEEVAGELGTDGTAEDEAAYLYESAKLPHNTNPACLVCFRQLKGRKAIHSTLTRCGVICDGLCLQIHLRKCETCACAEAVEEIPVDCRGAYLDALGTLPGFEHVAEERAAAAAEAEGEMLSLDFSRPAPSISATTGAMEKHSPLFRESSANPQLSLF